MGVPGSGIPGQFPQLDCQRQGTADALAAPGLGSKIAFVSFVTTASHDRNCTNFSQQLLRILGKHILFWEHRVWVSKTKF